MDYIHQIREDSFYHHFHLNYRFHLLYQYRYFLFFSSIELFSTKDEKLFLIIPNIFLLFSISSSSSLIILSFTLKNNFLYLFCFKYLFNCLS